MHHGDVSPSRDSYNAAAPAWQRGPAKLYDRLAKVLVGSCPRTLPGCRVLDLGAGTGAVSRAAGAHGANVVAADAAWGMLAADRERRPPAVVADVAELPFTGGVFDAVVGSFVFNHVAGCSRPASRRAGPTRRRTLWMTRRRATAMPNRAGTPT